MNGMPPADTAAPARARVEVRHEPARHRFTAERDGRPIGFLAYARIGRKMLVTHTEVAAAERRNGVGGALVRSAVEDVRANGLLLRPLCAFAARWIGWHPEHVGVVDPVDRDRLAADR